MYCGEGDYAECIRALSSQVGVIVQHVVIADLPEKQAHNALWQAWRDQKHGFDMFVKLDADTVLAHDKVLLGFWNVMEANSRVTGIQAPLLDYFTGGYINGLNCFSPRVTFRDTADELFCDRRVDVDHDIVIGSTQVPDVLRPAGYHGYHPTDAQAFHFGLHRALKGQTHVIEQVKQAWKRSGDRAHGLALIGASCAETFRDGSFNYTDDRFKVALKAATSRFDILKENL